MGRPTMRCSVRLPRALAAALVALALVPLGLVPALAQAPSPGAETVRLTLVRQTPFASPKDPLAELAVDATNEGPTALDGLSVAITLWSAVRSRTTYEESLHADPVGADIVASRTVAVSGVIQPGATREIPLTVGLANLIGGDQSLVYPMRVELKRGELTLATIRTPVVFLVRNPKVPLALSWTFVLHQPVLFGPDGRFRSAALERSVSPGGRLAAEVEALRAMAEGVHAVPVDVVLSPTFLIQLERMRDGYAVVEEDGAVSQVPAGEGGAVAAEETLASLRSVVSREGTETVAFPFAAPSLPALLAGGLAKDVPAQFERGVAVVEQLTGAPASGTVFRAPGSWLDGDTLDTLSARGVTLLLLNEDQTPPVEVPLDFAPPPTVSLRAAKGTIGAVTPDPGVQTLLGSELPSEDPVLAAQVVLGELATIWLESPGDERGVALIVTPEQGLPSAFYGPFIRGVSRAPWIEPVSASELATRVPPPEQPTRLIEEATSSFSRTYIEAIKQVRRHEGTYLSLLADPSAATDALAPDRVATMLLLAEGGQFVGNEEDGLAFVRSIQEGLDGELGKIRLDEGQQFTLTSQNRPIPVRLRNGTAAPVAVTVRLVSPHLRLDRGNAETVTLEPGDNVVNFDVHLETAGVFEVQVLIESPSGGEISEGTLTVRSTAFNRIALWITLAAGILFLALWARRLLPRRRTS